MKAKPLENKQCVYNNQKYYPYLSKEGEFISDLDGYKDIKNRPTAFVVFEKKDVKSAVEWLEFKLRDVGIYQGQEWQRVADLIREAFEDVVNEE